MQWKDFFGVGWHVADHCAIQIAELFFSADRGYHQLSARARKGCWHIFTLLEFLQADKVFDSLFSCKQNIKSILQAQ